MITRVPLCLMLFFVAGIDMAAIEGPSNSQYIEHRSILSEGAASLNVYAFSDPENGVFHGTPCAPNPPYPLRLDYKHVQPGESQDPSDSNPPSRPIMPSKIGIK